MKQWAIHFLLVATLLGVLAVWAHRDNQATTRREFNTRHAFCVELEEVRTFARDAAKRGLESLPTIDYYKTHPAEFNTAIRNLEQQIAYFSPPLDCVMFARNLN
jgi:hypothetical protein